MILVEEKQTKMNIEDDMEPDLKASIFHYCVRGVGTRSSGYISYAFCKPIKSCVCFCFLPYMWL